MAIVARGLGQPEDGAIVAAGLGTAEPAAPGGMSALLTGTGSLTATLDSTTGETSTAGQPGGWAMPIQIGARRRYYADMAAVITARGSVEATATYTVSIDLSLLVALELV